MQTLNFILCLLTAEVNENTISFLSIFKAMMNDRLYIYLNFTPTFIPTYN
jgi:hypothetical protein